MSGNGATLVINNIGTKFGVVNTGMGAKNPDGSTNVSGLLQGTAATALGYAELFGKSWGPAQVTVGFWGARNAIDQMQQSYAKTGTINASDVFSLAGNVGNMAIGVAKTASPWGAAYTVTMVGAEFGSRLIESRTANQSNDKPLVIEIRGYGSIEGAPLASYNIPEYRIPAVLSPSLTGAKEDIIDWNWNAAQTAAIPSDHTSSNAQSFAQDLANDTSSRQSDPLNDYNWNSSSSDTSYDTSTGSSDPFYYDDWNWGSSGSDSSYDYDYGYDTDYSYTDYSMGGGWWPLVIDLDGDGVEIKPLTASATLFDIDSDGYAERTAWAGADDGMLVIDLGGDGQITQAKEMAFGDWTAEADTDLQAMARTFDSNGDGTFDSRDARFNEFRIWKDADGDGSVDAGEMQTLEEAGLRSMTLHVKDGTAVDLDDGSTVHGLFDVQRSDGKIVQGADVTLAYATRGMRQETDAQGNTVFRLESGDVVKQRRLGAGETDFALTTATWIGAVGNELANRLDASTATWDVVLDGGAGNDTLIGGSGHDWLMGGDGADKLTGGAGDDVLLADAADVAAAQAGTGTLDGGAGFDQIIVAGSSAQTIDADRFNVEAIQTGNGDDRLTGARDASSYVFDSGAGNDALTTAGGKDILLAGAGNDTLDSGAGDDQLLGDAGNDVLKAGKGDDVLSGGTETDRLEGGAGNDVYVYNRGDGADRILDYAEDWHKEKYAYQEQVSYTEQYSYYERVQRGSGKNASWVNELRTGYRTNTRTEERIGYRDVFGEVDGGIDTLQFGVGIAVQDIVLARAGDDMVVTLRAADNENALSADSVTVEGWADEKNRIENFAFADGNMLDFSQIVNGQNGMAANDSLTGTANGDFLSGGGGNDTLTGGAGKDVLLGGTGDDRLDGGEGKDLLFAGAGNDQLIGGDADDYLIADAGNDTLDGGNGDDVLAGMDGNDTLSGGEGKDMLLGGAGADVLMGGGGDDTYFYFRGDGKDEIFDNKERQETYQEQIYAGSVYQRSGKSGNWVAQYRTETRVRTVQDDGGKDSLQFGQGIALDDLFFQMNGSDLVVGLREGTDTALADMDDQVKIRQWNNAMNRIETFGFADGLTLDMSNIVQVGSGHGAADNLNGHAGGDLLAGGAGNDTLNGLAGNDYLIGGEGNDQMDGGAGDDDLFGGMGEDRLEGGDGVDYLLGGTGGDTINGGNGNDVITGGTGNDILNGGRGNDIYHFNRGDGRDTIDEAALGRETIQEAYTYTTQVLQARTNGKSSYQVWVNETRTGYRSVLRTVEGGEDTVEFGRDIDISDIMLARSGADLVISLLPPEGAEITDSITVKGWTTPEYRVENLRFINDFAVDIGDIANAKAGTAGNDLLSASAGEATWLGGGASDDTLNGSTAADVLHGATGNDALNGGAGDDIYIFGRGDGKDIVADSGSAGVGTDKERPGGDKLLFGTDITMEDLVLSRAGSDMVIYLRDRENPEGSLASLTDAVTVRNWSDVSQRLEVFQFFDGKDFDVSELSNTYLGRDGQDSADTLSGSASADWMDGFAGNDTLRAGAGKDYVIGGSGNDALFGDAGNDLLSGGAGDDTVNGGAGDDVMVGDTGNDTLQGDAGNDVLAGGAGDDFFDAGAGDDVIIGDTGNDTYQAGAGFDVYRFGFGDGNDTYIGSEQAGVNGTDVIQLEADISKESLWFERVGNDLAMRLLGATDSMTFKDWYLSTNPAKNWNAPNDAKRYVYGFEAGGELLTYGKVNSLVSAMAGFTPNDGETAYGVTASELPSSVRSAVNSAWMAAA